MSTDIFIISSTNKVLHITLSIAERQDVAQVSHLLRVNLQKRPEERQSDQTRVRVPRWRRNNA